MANQSPDRRDVLLLLGRVAAVAQFPGFSRWICAAESHEGHVPLQRPATYQPQFFSPGEYSAVDLLTEHIIPRDTSPGAHDAGVVEFIDFLVFHDPELQYPFRTGLAWLDTFATEKHGAPFAKLATADREALLRKLAYRAEFAPEEADGQEFFALLRKYTVTGYYTSRAGLEELDYPGLRFYSASPECPHHNDPEHKHLAGAKA